MEIWRHELPRQTEGKEVVQSRRHWLHTAKKEKKYKGRGGNHLLQPTVNKTSLAGFKQQPGRLRFTFLTTRMIKDYLQT